MTINLPGLDLGPITAGPVDPWHLAPSGDPVPFGYGRLVTEERTPGLGLGGRIGSRPLLLVVVEAPEGDRRHGTLARTAEQYTSWFFDPAVSDGPARFFAELGARLVPVLPGPAPVLTIDDPALLTSARGIEDRARWVVGQLVERHGLEVFRAVDAAANGDGTVRGVELPVVVVDAFSQTAAAARRSAFAVPGLGFDLPVIAMGHRMSLLTAVHEILHTWGCVDLYGSGGGINRHLTTMADTHTSLPDDRACIDLDAWHRVQLGLTRPDVVDIATTPRGTRVVPTVAHARERSAVLFWDSRVGPQEHLLVELRSRDWRSLDRDVTPGFVLWRVSLDADGSPRVDGDNSMIRAYGPDGVLGSGVTWQSGQRVDGVPLPDGGRMPVALSLHRRDARSGVVSWGSTLPSKIPPFRWPDRLRVPPVIGGLGRWAPPRG